jgi:roadblock/LC7 domain-containing protein
VAEKSPEELLAIPGVVAAGRFHRDGRLADYVSKRPMSPDIAQEIAEACATVTMLFDILADVFSMRSGMEWAPHKTWMYAGGEWTVAIGGDLGVFAQTGEVDLNALHEALAAGRPTQPDIRRAARREAYGA